MAEEARGLAGYARPVAAIDMLGAESLPDRGQALDRLAELQAPQARPTALMAPAEVPTMTGKGLPALSGSRSAMAARTPTW